MKQFILSLSFVILSFGVDTFAADKGAPTVNMQEMMQKFEAAATPGKEHKVLADIAGSWKTASSMWHSVDAKPEISKGKATFKMILGGRWLQQDFKGAAMGQPFQGIGFVGYDNVKQKYISFWIDSMSTGFMESEGDFDASTKTLKDKGNVSCPISPSKSQEIRGEWQMISKNKMIFSMYGNGHLTNGPEFKMMEVTYTR